ncbi:iron complex transport system permease protein [Palleronia marisminoris]|uniref:Putative siderophore transport system permease protein YfiZ n=1 Tax=Palleronia marisminoris TaxID=315423 RepID=A0A1Y5RFA0_9RHOB|nr:iron ABC transporter permease [Palleronia marisminoris]SFG10991.1 iron complex transport system permease protein [Palleronia marisminoris]SLN13486.1 putative siderophore transport system permease protein YfiZ precursor [Palleronia marisminoris]
MRHLPLPAILIALPLAAALWHLSAGAQSIPWETVLHALAMPGESFETVVIREIRLPRTLGAAIAGAGLGVAGALMQGVTRNPLAEPGLFGLLAGAALAVVAGQSVPGLGGVAALPFLAALGAVAGAAMVWALTTLARSGSELTPVLAGAAVTAFLVALTTLLNLLDERGFEELRIWLSGSLAGLRMTVILTVLPWVLCGFGAALFIGPRLTALAMGDEAATGLGLSVARLRAAAIAAVVALTAVGVAVAGPLAFVGLTVPHAARLLVGTDYARVVPVSMGLGAAYLLGVDTLARIVLSPSEISTGILTAILGAPVFIALVRLRA